MPIMCSECFAEVVCDEAIGCDSELCLAFYKALESKIVSPDKQRDKIAEKIAACRWCDKDGWYYPIGDGQLERIKCDHK